MENTNNKPLTKHFEASFHWNLWWSILYEVLRIAHNIFLAKQVSQTTYGLIGTIFASMYLMAKCADMGTAYSIAPFFSSISTDKKSFKKFILNYSLLPLSCSLAGGFLLAFTLTTKINLIPSSLIPIIIGIIILETFRSFFRQLLHIAFKSRSIVIVEFILFITYLIGVWGSHLWLGIPLDTMLIFSLFLIDSTLAVMFLVYKTYTIYQTLPTDGKECQPSCIRIFRLRFSNFFVRMSNNLSTTNILTPLFAVKFGLKSAGIFYLISTIAMAMQAIIKAAIGHPGNALLARVKDQPLLIKQEAFTLLSTRFLMVIFGIMIGAGILCHYIQSIHSIGSHDPTTILLIGGYILITLSDLFITLYEYFYVLEESMAFLCSLRFIEILLFYMIGLYYQLPPLVTLVGIFSIRGITLICMILYAYLSWKLVLKLSNPVKYLGGCVITLLLIKSLSLLIKF